MKFCVHVKNKNSVQSNNGFLKIYKNNKTKRFFFFFRIRKNTFNKKLLNDITLKRNLYNLIRYQINILIF